MIDLHLSAFAPRWRFLYAVRIDAYEASGTTAGMGRSNSGLQKQRIVSQAVVQGERNHTNYILSLGTRAVVYCWLNGDAA